MTLPNISIPIHIPIEIPTMLHPPLVHFAVAIPVLVLLLEIINLFLKTKSLKIITSTLLFLTIFILFGAYLAGITDGKAAIDSGSFSGVSELKEHKLLGTYLVYASAVIFIFKLLSLVINKTAFRVFYILILIAFTSSILHQGKEGGELVYKYGANVKLQSDDFDDDEEDSEKATAKETKTEQSTKSKETTEENTTTQPKETPKQEEEIKNEEETNSSKLQNSTTTPKAPEELEKESQEATTEVTPIQTKENNNSNE